MHLRAIWKLFPDTVTQWTEDKPFQLAAALAYYTLFSLAPLLLIAIAVAGLVFGRDASQRQMISTMQGLVGPQGAQAIQALIQNASTPSSGLLATLIGVVTLLLGAGSVVGQLQDSLNTIWGVAPKPGLGLRGLVRTRLVSFGLVLGIGFLLLVSLLVSAALTAVLQVVARGSAGTSVLWHSIELAVSFGLTTLLFALIYKVLPDVRLAWRDVGMGAAMTALLFTLGKFLIGLYLGRSGISSAYGAAGSLVLVLVWVYYSGLIFFFGAEFTQVYANTYGTGVKPEKDAMVVEDKTGRTKAELQDGNGPRVPRSPEQEPGRTLPLRERHRESQGQPVAPPITAAQGEEVQQGRERQKDPYGWSDARRGHPNAAKRPDTLANTEETAGRRRMTPPVDDQPHKKADPRAPLIESLSLVKEGVRDTAAAVQALGAETAAQTKDLVDTTVVAAQQTMEGVQSIAEEMGKQVIHAVGETAAMVQRTHTLRAQVEQHPWRIVGGAVLVGYLLGSWGNGGTSAVSTTDRKRAPARPSAP